MRYPELGHMQSAPPCPVWARTQAGNPTARGRASLIAQATKVAAHLQRTGASTGGPTFVWTKKIERELESGKTVRDIANAQSRISQAERMVSGPGCERSVGEG